MRTDELTHRTEWMQIGRWQVSSELFLDTVFTEKCNRRCAYCIARTRRRCPEDLPAWQSSLAAAFERFPIKSVVILGGEATADPLFWQKLELVEEQVRLHHAERIVLTTNGTLLAEEGFLSRLCASGVDAVNLSRMHDDQAVNDACFGGPTPGRDDIRRMYGALSAAGKTLRLNVNIWRGNLDKAEEMERFADVFEGCCDAVKFSPLMDTAMFDTVEEVERFTRERALPAEEIRALYDRFLSRQRVLSRHRDVLGFVDYAEAMRGSLRVLLKFAQVEDLYDRSSVIPTLKLYPNGCLSNEWSWEKALPDTL